MQRYFGTRYDEENIRLCNDDIYHIFTVMRMKTGDVIEVICEDSIFLCEVNVNRKNSFTIKKELEKKEEFIPKVTLILPLLKEQKMDFIFQKTTELGVDEFLIIDMERSVIKLEKQDENKMAKKIDRWIKICKEASEQSKRMKMPKITYLKDIEKLKNLDGIKLVCSTKDSIPSIKNILTETPNYDRISIVIGPEGGITDKEENVLSNLGFIKVSLGSRILRAETAPITVLSFINYEYMR